MSNNRIFYACQAVGIGPYQTAPIQNISNNPIAPINPVHGAQSVGISTSFNLEQAFELGQIDIYENIEGIPEVEVTIEKVLDGYPLIYLLATTGVETMLTKDNLDNQYGWSLLKRSQQRCNVVLGIWDETVDYVGQDNNAVITQIVMSGMYVSSLNYTFPVEGNCTESVTLVGNSKGFYGQPLVNGNVAQQQVASVLPNTFSTVDPGPKFRIGPETNGIPDAPLGSGGIQRRENVDMLLSILPSVIPGVGDNEIPGNNSIASAGGAIVPIAHIQNITISCDLGREDILELGRKTPYVKTPTFPVEVSTEFEVIATESDRVNAHETQENLSNHIIYIKLTDGTTFDLGSLNKLTSVNYTGGDAGGGNATITYSFVNYNNFRVLGTNLSNLPNQNRNSSY